MSQRWKHLQGEQLAAFAASPKALKETPHLIAHIAKHGTVDDFNNVINQHQNPVAYCVQVYRRFPQAAEQWLLNALNRVDENTALTHYEVLRGVLANDVPKKCLPHLKFAVLSHDQLEDVFLPLLRNGFKTHIETNWGVFASVVRGSSANVKVLEAAAVGWDLAGLINWSPTSDTRDMYFNCCCQGGLLEQVKHTLPPTTWEVVGEAFVNTCIKRPKNAEDVLNYLWNTFPQTPWHMFNKIMSRVCTVSPTLTEKMLTHFKTHASDSVMDEAYTVACVAAYHGKVDVMHKFLPYVHATQHHNVVSNAMESKNKDALKSLLALPGDTLHWKYIMHFLPPWSKQRLEEYMTAEQAKVLRASIGSNSLPTPKRKI